MLTIIALISPLLVLLFILLFCFRNSSKENNLDLRRFALPLGCIFGLFGYSIRYSATSNDLLRYYDHVESIGGASYLDVVSSSGDGLFVRDALFYFVNRCQNVHVLPFIVGLIIYSIVFYVLFDMVHRSKKRLRVGEIFLMAVIAVGLISPCIIIGNVRCVLAFVLVVFAAYRDMVQKKKNIVTLLLYLLPLWLHSSAVVIIIIRLLSTLFRRIRKMKWTMLSIVFLFPLIVDFCNTHLVGILSGPIGNILDTAIQRAYFYLHWDSGGWASQVDGSIHSTLIKIFGTIFILLFLFILLKRCPKSASTSSDQLLNNPMICFLFLVSIFALGCLHIKTGAFWRFESIVVLFSPIVFVEAINLDESYKRLMYIVATYICVPLLYNILYMCTVLSPGGTLYDYVFIPGVRAVYDLINGVINVLLG